MILKILKILTVLSFLMITFDSGHLGGQFGIYIILGLFFGFQEAILAALFLIILALFLLSSFKNLKTKDLYIFIIGGLILMIPIIAHIRFLLITMKNRGDKVFYLTLLPFLTFYGLTLFKIIRENKKMKNSKLIEK
jgi:hypothetical protein